MWLCQGTHTDKTQAKLQSKGQLKSGSKQMVGLMEPTLFVLGPVMPVLLIRDRRKQLGLEAVGSREDLCGVGHRGPCLAAVFLL